MHGQVEVQNMLPLIIRKIQMDDHTVSRLVSCLVCSVSYIMVINLKKKSVYEQIFSCHVYSANYLK